MGHCCSKSQKLIEFSDHVDNLEKVAHQRPWLHQSTKIERINHLERYATGVIEAVQIAQRSKWELFARRLAAIVMVISRDLVEMLDAPLIRSKDTVASQKVQNLAKALSSYAVIDDRGNRVNNRVWNILHDKWVSLHGHFAQEYLAKAAALMQRTDSSTFPEAAPQILTAFREVQPHLKEAPGMVSVMGAQANILKEKVLESLRMHGESDTGLFKRFAGLGRSLDELMQAHSAPGTGVTWKPILPSIEAMRAKAAQKMLPRLIEDLDQKLDEGSSAIDDPALEQLKGQIAPLWPDHPLEMRERLTACFAKLEALIEQAFARALELGEAASLEKLVNHAMSLDQTRLSLLKEGDPEKFSKRLASVKAGVTLKTLLSNAEGSVTNRTAEIHAAFEVADSKAKAVPREQLKEKSQTCSWAFKLGSGKYKDYTPDKSAEVEALYQRWVTNGKPAEKRRFEVTIPVEVARRTSRMTTPSTPAGSGTVTDSTYGSRLTSGGRPRCNYGEKCFRKNPAHKAEFSHPGDQDWDDETSTTASPAPPCCQGGTSPSPSPSPPVVPPLPPPAASESLMASEASEGQHPPLPGTANSGATVKEEKFSLDFMLMTQVNVTTKRGMRPIKRFEGKTYAEQVTEDYFAMVVDFVKEAEQILAAAEVELRLLGESERQDMQSQVDALLQAMRPSLSEFLELAVFIENMKVIDDVLALLGTHTEGLGLKHALQRIRKKDVLEELQRACHPDSNPTSAPWDILRLMCKKQPIGGFLYRYRCERIKTKREIEAKMQRHAQIRCQALLSEYDNDAAFKKEFRDDAVVILSGILNAAGERGPADVYKNTLRMAAIFGCDTDQLLPQARLFVSTMVRKAVTSRIQPLSRVVEVMETGLEIAKAMNRSYADDIMELTPLYPLIAQRLMSDVKLLLDAPAKKERIDASLDLHKGMKATIGKQEVVDGLWGHFWGLFKELYEGELSKDTTKQARAVEWAVALCEQMKWTLPKWMMNKDQVEALRRCREAIGTGQEEDLRAAVIFAKQADYKSDPLLKGSVDDAIAVLRRLKRLPDGWPVEELAEAEGKMFMKIESDGLISVFQQLFDTTNIGIVTRDRKDSMPRGYTVTKVEAVCNVESWSHYLKRVDRVAEQCKRFADTAPVKSWDGWSGPLLTSEAGTTLATMGKMPPLNEGANEFLMFHGTNPEAANSIAKSSFDMAFACKTGLFGAGIYFAESSSKSDEYVRCNAAGQFPIIMCRVALGRINYCDTVDPTKDPGREKLEGSCLRGDYHSVLGDRKKTRGTYREFIVYDHYQVYPAYIVWYSRISG